MRLDFLPRAQKKLTSLCRALHTILWLNLGLKPLERVTNKRLDLGQASAGALGL